MDSTQRQITKIAREVQSFVTSSMKLQGVGSGECDILHLVRKNPGISCIEISRILVMDKAAIARRVASLERKGFLTRETDSDDKRRQHLYATKRCEEAKESKTMLETRFYEWLTDGLSGEELGQFTAVLNRLYMKSKAESRAGFPHLRME